MSQSYGDWTEEEQDAWEFVAGDEACERCQALDGSQWDEPPSLPHQYCNCEITPAHPHGDDPWGNLDDCGNSWAADITVNVEEYGPTDDPGLEWEVEITVECNDGSGGEYRFWVDSGRDSAYQTPLDRGAYIWDNAYDQAEEIMSQVCQCSEELIR